MFALFPSDFSTGACFKAVSAGSSSDFASRETLVRDLTSPEQLKRLAGTSPSFSRARKFLEYGQALSLNIFASGVTERWFRSRAISVSNKLRRSRPHLSLYKGCATQGMSKQDKGS